MAAFSLGYDDRALRLRILLASVGISRADVARATGVTPGSVSAWTRGRKRPSPAARVALLRVLSEAMAEAIP